MHDVAVNCVRSKDAQKQLARTSLNVWTGIWADNGQNIFFDKSTVFNEFKKIQDFTQKQNHTEIEAERTDNNETNNKVNKRSNEEAITIVYSHF